MASDIEHTRVIPLYYEAYSQEFEEFLSENDQLFLALDVVSRYVERAGGSGPFIGEDIGIGSLINVSIRMAPSDLLFDYGTEARPGSSWGEEGML